MLKPVQANKVVGFGGDYRFPELSDSHAKMAGRNAARVMAEQVAEGFWTETQAAEIARMILHDNPDRMFGCRWGSWD